MSQLDDPKFVLRLDPKGIYDLAADFPDQCARAYEIAKAAELPQGGLAPDVTILTGLGGSAAGGDFVRALFEAQGKTPFLVNRDYSLPAYVNKHSLVFTVSYSGNTEETLSAFAQARQRGASVVAVTSGGKLAELAAADHCPVIKVPGGQPPRTALGYLLVPVIVACSRMGLIPEQDVEGAIALLRNCLRDWGVDSPFVHNPTKQLAEAVHGKLALLYGLGSWQAVVAGRWKGQFNENAKTMTFANVFPELCHNEIIGWVNAHNQGVRQWATVLLKDGTESAKMAARAKITLGLIKEKAEQYEVVARGENLMQKMLALTYFGDFVSIYLAALNGVDPENIDSINTLKAELAKIQ